MGNTCFGKSAPISERWILEILFWIAWKSSQLCGRTAQTPVHRAPYTNKPEISALKCFLDSAEKIRWQGQQFEEVTDQLSIRSLKPWPALSLSPLLISVIHCYRRLVGLVFKQWEYFLCSHMSIQKSKSNSRSFLQYSFRWVTHTYFLQAQNLEAFHSASLEQTRLQKRAQAQGHLPAQLLCSRADVHSPKGSKRDAYPQLHTSMAGV